MPLFFCFTDTSTPEIYTLSLHDALPICLARRRVLRAKLKRGRTRLENRRGEGARIDRARAQRFSRRDRKSTRLNSSHRTISYAVFCLKKKKKKTKHQTSRAHSSPQHTST